MFKIGALVKLVFDKANQEWVGIVIKTENDYQYGKLYYIAFTDGDTEWCLEEDLEEVCK